MTLIARTSLLLSLSLGIFLGRAGAESGVKPLYDRLGGKPAVTAVIDDFVGRIVADEQVNRWFHHAAATPENLAAYKSKLSDLVCQATGGPCQYTGMDMVSAHKGRAVTGDAFDRVVSHLVATLDKFNVPQREKTELLGILAPLKKAIVEKP